MERFEDVPNLSKLTIVMLLALIVGFKDGTVELVNRIHKKITFSRPFHAGGSVVSVCGKQDYLYTAGTDDIINIYNTKTTIIEREMNLKSDSFTGVSGVLKLTNGDKEIIITDEFYGLTWFSYDLENPIKDYPDIGYKPLVKLFGGISDSEDIFGTSNDKGVIKVWWRNADEKEEELAVEVVEIRKFRGHKGEVKAMKGFRDGSFVSGGADGTYRIWTTRKDVKRIGQVDSGQGGCCGTGGK
jgi:WD40 repeat protein